MKSDGKQLEGLVSFVEKTLLPQGFDVRTNERVYNDEGVQIAEFDIEIHGRIGSTSIEWLIECRDRPGQGPAPGSWIEQLVGRRIRFGFNKVTAVSTTGFAPGAVEFARKERIELREVKALKPEEFANWLVMQHFSFIQTVAKLEHATICVKESPNKGGLEALAHLLSNISGDAKFLKASKTGEVVSAAEAFRRVVSGEGSLLDDLKLNGPGKKIRLEVHYTNETDHFVVDTAFGKICVEKIHFVGEISMSEAHIPLTLVAEYRQLGTGEPISQVASFEPHPMHGKMLSFEIHRISESGETYVVLRKLPDNN